MEHRIDLPAMEQYARLLTEEEKSAATVEKYLRDLRALAVYAGAGGVVTKEVAVGFKRQLLTRYTAATVNGMLASVNGFFKRMGWYDCVVRTLKIQRDPFRAQERELSREEYYRLLQAAEEKGDRRLYLLLQTICATGIRVSELRFITVEALKSRRARVSLKGKTRTVILTGALCRLLREYVREKGIRTGSIFITKTGKPLDRSNIFRAMKALCGAARVAWKKVFPHNLRHLFACTYYQADRDLARLADVLGHSSVDTTRIYLMRSSVEQEARLEHLKLVLQRDAGT